jgi:hypothetical protein
MPIKDPEKRRAYQRNWEKGNRELLKQTKIKLGILDKRFKKNRSKQLAEK